jgi:hypothetical protein
MLLYDDQPRFVILGGVRDELEKYNSLLVYLNLNVGFNKDI